MAEAIAALSLIATVAQLTTYGWTLCRRLSEFQEDVGRVPKEFQDISVQLPLLLDILQSTSANAQSGNVSEERLSVLLPVIDGCGIQIRMLDELLVNTLPAKGDSSLRKSIKAAVSVNRGKKIRRAMEIMQGYVQILTFHQTTPSLAMPIQPWRDLKSNFIIPYVRKDDFIGRDEVLTSIQRTQASAGCIALVGIGGMGKTQIVVEYCCRFREMYSDVFWLDCSTSASFQESCNSIVETAKLPGHDNKVKDSVDILQKRLEESRSHTQLLVLDNLDDMSSLNNSFRDMVIKYRQDPTAMDRRKYLFIVTTREKVIGSTLAGAQFCINLGPIDIGSACTLLQSQSDFESVDNSDCIELVNRLDRSPLGITQAAAFMMQRGIDTKEFLANYSASEVKIRGQRHIPETAHTPVSIEKTLDLQLRQLHEREPFTLYLLSVIAFFGQEKIPAHLLRNGTDNFKCIKALGTLQAFSIINASIDDSGLTNFSIHRVVQEFVLKKLRQDRTVDYYRQAAVNALMKSQPWTAHHSAMINGRKMLPHAESVLNSWIKEGSLTSEVTLSSEGAAELNSGPGSSLASAASSFVGLLRSVIHLQIVDGRSGSAIRNSNASVLFLDSVLGDDNCHAISAAILLARSLNASARYREAESLLRKFRASCSKAMPQSVEAKCTIAEVCLFLAMNLHWQERFDEAIPLLEENIRELSLIVPPSHPLLRSCQTSLGAVLSASGQLSEAETLNSNLLLALDNADGDPQQALGVLQELSLNCEWQKKHSEAQHYAKRATMLAETEYGTAHPVSWGCRIILARVLISLGRYQSARMMLQQILRIQRKEQAEQHPHTIRTMEMLATALLHLGDLDTGMALANEAVEKALEVFGAEHPTTKLCEETLLSLQKSRIAANEDCSFAR